MAEQNQSISANVEAAQNFLEELKARAKEAHDGGNIFMLDLYNELLRVTSPIVTRAFSRKEREERARINKAHKALRKQAREAREAAKKQAEQKGASPESKTAQAEA